MFGPVRFRFLNEEHELNESTDWATPKRSALWNYNLHYFNDLNAEGSEDRSAWHRQLIARWLVDNLPVRRPAWDAFPTAVRLVNWVKWLWRGNEPLPGMIESMVAQARWLERRIEYHLLGNHVLVDAKGLIFAGLAFGQAEGDRWLKLGLNLLREQLKEQILPDGGHFELSPMYHSLVVEDLLDVINAGRGVIQEAVLNELQEHAAQGLGWLEALTDENGLVPLLNDAAYGVAATPKQLHGYADRLGIQPDYSKLKVAEFVHGWKGRCCSGYWVLDFRGLKLWFDTAPIGPDYQPGHAHGDMLSILVSIQGEQILTDTGVSTYEQGAQRDYERSVAAHNTVQIDGLDQAQFWGRFRVGKRGRPTGFKALPDGIECSHNGFAMQRRGVSHVRRVELCPDGFAITDTISGPGEHRFDAFFHFAPGVLVQRKSETLFDVAGKLVFEIQGGQSILGQSDYCPEYGLRVTRPCLKVCGTIRRTGKLTVKCTYCF